MPPRFDQESLELHLSVADLIERDAAGSLGFASRGGFERLWMGQAIHSQYQERALAEDATYQREVVLRTTFEHRGWTIHVQGRADGLRLVDGRPMIEEIKSVRPDTPLAPSTLDLYRRQLRLYGWLHARRDLDPAEALEAPGRGTDDAAEPAILARLVLIEIGSFDGTGSENVDIDAEPHLVELLVRRQINAILAEHQRSAEARAQRREAAERLQFPFHQPRPGQTQIIDATSRALEQREHLLVQAPTGLGKTASTLFPAIRHALETDRRIFVLTAKNLQQKMATRVVDMLNRDASYSSVQIRAKASMCANGEVLCHEEYCSYARDYFGKLHQTKLLDRLLGDNRHLDPDRVFDAAKREVVCPFEVSLELSRRTQVVVCDYNYAFAPYVALTDFGPEADLSDTILVIDEIHNLVPRSRDYYSPTLSARQALDAAERISHQAVGSGALIAARLESAAKDLARLIETAVDFEVPPSNRPATVLASLPEDDLWRLRPQFDRLFVEYLEHRRETKSFRPEDPFVDLYFELLRFLNTLALANECLDNRFSHCLERQGQDRRLRIFCKDASPFVGSVLNRCHSVIGLSATLQPTDFYRDLLGFDPERTGTIEVGNPFPPEHRVLTVDASVSTTYKERARHYQPIAERIREFAEQVPGNCLVLFPSYAFLSEVAGRIGQPSTKRVLIQGRADTAEQRNEILDSLSNALFGKVLLLAVAGGVFAEGVDYPGDMLEAVVVVGPCLPAVSLEQRLLQEYFDERFDRGFEYSFVVPGMTRVVQAAGRLIRTPTDRGVIVLMGRRFRSKMYRRHMPSDWIEALEQSDAGHPATVAASFFRTVPGDDPT